MTARRWLYAGAALSSVLAGSVVLGLWGFALAAGIGAYICAREYRDAKRGGR